MACLAPEPPRLYRAGLVFLLIKKRGPGRPPAGGVLNVKIARSGTQSALRIVVLRVPEHETPAAELLRRLDLGTDASSAVLHDDIPFRAHHVLFGALGVAAAVDVRDAEVLDPWPRDNRQTILAKNLEPLRERAFVDESRVQVRVLHPELVALIVRGVRHGRNDVEVFRRGLEALADARLNPVQVDVAVDVDRELGAHAAMGGSSPRRRRAKNSSITACFGSDRSQCG